MFILHPVAVAAALTTINLPSDVILAEDHSRTRNILSLEQPSQTLPWSSAHEHTTYTCSLQYPTYQTENGNTYCIEA